MHSVKIYIDLQKTRHNNEKFVWTNILNNSYDDMKTYIDPENRLWLDKFAEDLLDICYIVAEEIEKDAKQIMEDCQNDNNKISQIVNTKDKSISSIYWSIMKGKNALENLVKLILRNIDKHFEEMRTLLGGINIIDYKPKKEINFEIKILDDNVEDDNLEDDE